MNWGEGRAPQEADLGMWRIAAHPDVALPPAKSGILIHPVPFTDDHIDNPLTTCCCCPPLSEAFPDSRPALVPAAGAGKTGEDEFVKLWLEFVPVSVFLSQVRPPRRNIVVSLRPPGREEGGRMTREANESFPQSACPVTSDHFAVPRHLSHTHKSELQSPSGPTPPATQMLPLCSAAAMPSRRDQIVVKDTSVHATPS